MRSLFYIKFRLICSSLLYVTIPFVWLLCSTSFCVKLFTYITFFFMFNVYMQPYGYDRPLTPTPWRLWSSLVNWPIFDLPFLRCLTARAALLVLGLWAITSLPECDSFLGATYYRAVPPFFGLPFDLTWLPFRYKFFPYINPLHIKPNNLLALYLLTSSVGMQACDDVMIGQHGRSHQEKIKCLTSLHWGPWG